MHKERGSENAHIRYVTKYLITISNPIELDRPLAKGETIHVPRKYDRHRRPDDRMHPKGNQSYYDDGLRPTAPPADLNPLVLHVFFLPPAR